MIRILTLLTFGIISILGMYAQGPIILSKHVLDSIARSRVSKSELLSFDILDKDLGSITDDGIIRTCHFHFINKQTDTVKIGRITTSCGCLTYTLKSKIIPPGGQGELIARYNPTNHIGPFEQRINIYAQGAATPMSVLIVKGKVLVGDEVVGLPFVMGDLRLSDKLLKFGELDRSQNVSKSINCLNAGSKPIRLQTVPQMTPKWIRFRTIPEVIPAGCNAEIVVTIEAAQIPERYDGEQRLNMILDGIEAIPSEKSLQLEFIIR